MNPTSMTIKLDRSQQDCLSDDHHILVNASAGSGKTTVIVERFLHLVEKGSAPDRLLLLTFTRKAAAEMQSRLYPQLFRAPYTSLPHVSRFIAEGRPLLVQTIDSFCGHIVRDNAHRIGIQTQTSNPPEYIHDRLEKLCIAYLSKQQHTPIIASLFDILPNRQPEKRLTYTLLLPLATNIFHPTRYINQEKNFQKILAYLQKERADLKSNIVSTITVMQALMCTNEKSQAFIANCAELLARNTEESFAALCTAIWKENLTAHAASPELKHSIITLRGKKKEKHSPIARYHLLSNYCTHADELQKQCSVLDHFERYIKTAKERENLYSFSDIFLLAIEILTKYPAVLQSIFAQFDHIMVDEFQDNNKEQFAFIQMLCGTRQTTQKDSASLHPQSYTGLFCVGDEKQSIYGFRGADLNAYMRLYDRMMEEGGTCIELVKNYRSTPFLISFFNAIFPHIFSLDDVSADPPEHNHAVSSPVQPETATPEATAAYQHIVSYTPVEPARAQTDIQSTVSLHVVPYNPEAHAQEADWVAQSIKNLVLSQTIIETKDGHRNIIYGDIALLFRKRTHIQQFEQALTKLDIPFSNPFTKNIEAEELYHVFTACLDLLTFSKNTSLAYLTLLRSPLLMLSDEAIIAVFTQKLPVFSREAAQYIEDKQERSQYSTACVHWNHLVKNIASPLYVLDYLWNQWGFRWYASEQAKHLLSHYDYLRTLVHAAPAQSVAALHIFLQEKKKRRNPPGTNIEHTDHNAVQLLSVHAAKGLEFPVVYVVDAASQTRSQAEPILFFTHETLGPIPSPPAVLADASHKEGITTAATFVPNSEQKIQKQQEDAEIRRLLYVALTRAQQMLFITASLSQKGSASATFFSLLCDALAFDLPSVVKQGISLNSSVFPDACITCITEDSDHLNASQHHPHSPNSDQDTSKSLPSHAANVTNPHASILRNEDNTFAIADVSRIRFSVTELVSGLHKKKPKKDTESPTPPLEKDAIPQLLGTITHAILDYGISDASLFASLNPDPIEQDQQKHRIKTLLNPQLKQSKLDADQIDHLIDNAISYAHRFFASPFWRKYHAAVVASEESIVFRFPLKSPRIILEGVIDLLIDPSITSPPQTSERPNQAQDLIPLSNSAVPNLRKTSEDPLIIVDYKTDAKKEPEKHMLQLSAYAYAINALYNRPCEAYLFYVRTEGISQDERLVPVPILDNIEEELLAQVENRTET